MSVLSALILTVGGASFGLGPEWQPVVDPLAEARAGKIYCDTPDHVSKTCEGAAVYRFGEGDEIMGVVMVPINNEPDLAIAMPMPSWVEHGGLCVRPEQADVDRMRIVVGTKPYDGPAGQKLLGIFKQEMAKLMVGKTICEYMFVHGDRLQSFAMVDGVHRAEFDGEIAWLDPDAMYDLRAEENILDE